MAMPTYGKGDAGLKPIRLECIPDSTMKDAIDVLITAGTEVAGRNVKWATGANRQVTDISDGDLPQGIIRDYKKTASSYRLFVDWYGFLDKAAAWHQAIKVSSFVFDSAPSLGDSVSFKNTTQCQSDNAGVGRVINVGVTTSDVML